jgi:uncharacterized paraquat-inducible protein A
MTPFRAWQKRHRETVINREPNAKRRCVSCKVEVQAHTPRCRVCTRQASTQRYREAGRFVGEIVARAVV